MRNRGPKVPPGKMDVEEKRAVQRDVNRSIQTIRNDDLGPYVEHELPATTKDAESEGPDARKTQPGKFSTDLYHITSRDIASRNAGSIPPPEQDSLSPVIEEDIYSSKQTHIRQFHKLNSFLGMDDHTPPGKREKHPQLDMAEKASGDWELFHFEHDEPRYQDTVSTVVVELEGSSISHISDPSEISGEIPPILRPGRRLPIGSVVNRTVSQAATVEKASTFPQTSNSPNELFLPCHEPSEILWSRLPRQQSKLRGYLASMRERHSISYKAYKKSDSRPTHVLKCPREITITKATPTSSLVESPFQFLDQGLLMPPAKLYKKKSRHQKLVADSIYVKELRVRRLSHTSITDEEFAERMDSIMQEAIVVLGD